MTWTQVGGLIILTLLLCGCVINLVEDLRTFIHKDSEAEEDLQEIF